MIKRFTQWLTPHHTLVLILALSAFESLATVIYQASMPADPTNSVFLGYSMRRLAVMAAILLLAILMGVLSFIAEKKPEWAEKVIHFLLHGRVISLILLPLLTLAALAGFTLALTPPLRFMPYDLQFKGLLPPITLAAIISAEAALLLAVQRFGVDTTNLASVLKDDHKIVRAFLVVLGMSILTWLTIVFSGIGLTPDVAYWNSAGVPLQSVQVVIAWIIGFGFLAAGLFPGKKEMTEPDTTESAASKKKAGWKFDLAVCLLLWIFSAALWIHEPQVRSFFAPGPSQPNQEFYPLSDAAGYDTAAQYALIGQGLDNGHHVDKPLYSTLLIFFHLLAGQDYARLVLIQSIFLAMIPVLMYLLGKNLHSRPAGIVAGLLAAFKGQNAIASAWMVLSANPKLLVSEYPMALGILAFTFFMVKWLKDEQRPALWGMLAGGMFGLSTMIRHNVWILLPFAFLVLWLAIGQINGKTLRSSAVFVGMLLITILPWTLRTFNETRSPLFFLPMLQNVFDQRYDVNLPGTGWSTPIPPIPTVSSESVAPASQTQTDENITKASISYTWHEENIAGCGTYDDDDTVFTYSGVWISSQDIKAYDGTLHTSTVQGNTAVLNFAGEKIRLAYPTGPAYGELEISIDGGKSTLIQQNDDKKQNVVQWESDILENGRHELLVTHKSGTMVALDAVEIKCPAPVVQRSDECPSAVPYHWINANLDSGLHSDDGVVAHQMPFTFRLDGEPYDQVYISANGLISFQEFASGVTQTAAIPNLVSPNEFIAPFWFDLNPSAGGTVLYDIYGETPRRLYVIEWRSVPLKNAEGTASFEVILFEGSNDILFQYAEMPAPEITSQAVIGMEYGHGLQGTALDNIVQHTVTNGLSMLFTNTPQECKICYDISVEAKPAEAGEVRMLPLPNCGNKYAAGTQLELSAAAGQYSGQWAESVTASSMGEGYTLPAGPPKVDICGDNQQAWSASKWGYQEEWLLLTYPKAVHAAGVSIHETNLGGVVTQIDFIEPDGTGHVVWQGTETTTCGEWFTPPLDLPGLATPYQVKQIKVTTRKWGWEELDAVELIYLEDSGYQFDYWNTNQQGDSIQFEVVNSARLAASFSETASNTAALDENEPEKTGVRSPTATPAPVQAIAEEIHEGSSFSAASDETPMSWFIPSHFAHNWIASALSFPLTLVNDSLRNIITDPGSVWAESWQGGLSFLSILLLFINLSLVALGTGSAWTRWRFAGVMPWVSFAGYSLGTAVARTSGGRYIVPIDWVFHLYFALGLVQFTIWLASLAGYRYKQYTEVRPVENRQVPSKKSSHLNKNWFAALIFALCLLAGASPLLTENAFPPTYEPLSKEQAFLTFIERGGAEKLNLDNEQLAAFAEREDTYIWMGKILYPRFYEAGEGEPAGGMYGIMDFPRLVFTIIGPGGPNEGERAANGVLPLAEAPANFPQGADALVIGCRNGNASVLAVMLMDEDEDTLYLRSPESPLECPLVEPVCDQDGKCR